MALRHKFPFRNLPDLRVDTIPMKPPPVMKEPRLIEFRPDSDIDAVVDSMVKYTRVRVSAATGAGKSTKLPVRLSRKAGKPVYLVVPSVHLARDHFEFLSRQYPGEVYVATGEKDGLSDSGVTVTTYAWLIGMLIVRRGHSKPLGDCIVFADEVHESDAYSYVTRKLSSNIPGVSSFIEVSATHDAARMPMREPLGKTETRFFPRMSPNLWDPADVGYPWSLTELTGNTMIMLDDDTQARRLVESYCTSGLSAYRMSSHMSEQQSQAALREMRKEDGGLVVLVADYSFRNGGTFDGTSIIDSGLVKKAVVKDGKLVHEHRMMFELEKYQTSARGGRTPGSTCVYWIPEGTEFKSSQCMLEGVEVEAAAVLLRVLGYAAPPELKALMALPVDKIPKDLSSVLNGFIPLAILPDAGLIDFVMPMPTLDTQAAASVIEEYGIETSPVVLVSNLFRDVDFAEQVPVAPSVSLSVLEELQQLSTAARTLEPGYYYSCSEAVANGSLGSVAWDALLKSLHDHPLITTGWSVEMRQDAVAKLLLQYNIFVVVGAAVTRVGLQREELGKAVRMYPEQVKTWSSWLTEKARYSESMCLSILKVLESVRTPSMVFKQVPADTKLEEKQAQGYVRPLLQAIEQATKVVDTVPFFKAIGDELGYDPGPEFPAIEDGQVVDEDTSESGSVKWKSVEVAGTVMHDMIFTPRNPLRWTRRDYQHAVANMLMEKGVDPRGVRKLIIDAPGVDCDVIMQGVRDGMRRKTKVLKYVVERKRK